MKNIVIPTDFSETAQNATHVALQLARRAQSKLHFMYFMSIPIDWIALDFSTNLYPEITDKIKHVNNQLDALVTNAEKEGIAAQKYLHFNESHAGIVKHAHELGADIIVIGSKGASGLKELLVGSNTERVIRHAKCPVLTVKANVDLDQIKSIMLATDLQPAQDPVVKTATYMQDLLGAKLIIAKLNTHHNWVASSEFLDDITKFASTHKITNYEPHVFDDDYLEDGIIKCAEKLDVDMIIMGTHGRTGIGHVIAGSVAEDVTNHTRRMILTVKL